MIRNRLTFWLDLVLLLVACSLMVTRFTGLRLHEWISVGLVPLLLLHLLFQWPWIANRTRRLTEPSWRHRLGYLINFGLFLSMVVTVQSGFVISRVVMPTLVESWTGDRRWGQVHGWASSLVLVFIGLHLALNWDWVASVLKRKLGLARSRA
jgi:cytochrome b561